MHAARAEPRYTFICVNYKGHEHTRALCQSLAAQEGCAAEIECIVVDNSCDAAEAEALQRIAVEFEGVRIVVSASNLGYFGGLNLGLQNVDPARRAFVVVGNNDLVFASDFFSKLANATYPANAQVICPSVITRDGINQNPHHVNRIRGLRKLKFDLYFSSFWVASALTFVRRLLPSRHAPQRTWLTGFEVCQGIGAIYVLTPAFFSKSRLLEYPNFLYAEEAYLSAQVHRNGGVLWFDPGLTVAHAESAATARMPRRLAYGYARDSYWQCRPLL